MNQVCFDCGRESAMPEAGGPPLCPNCGSSFVTPLADSGTPPSLHREPPRKSLFLPAKDEPSAPDDPFGRAGEEAAFEYAAPEEAASDLPGSPEPFADLVSPPGDEPLPPDAGGEPLPPPEPLPRPRERRTAVAAAAPLPPPPPSGIVPVLVAPALAAVPTLLLALFAAARLSAPPAPASVDTPSTSPVPSRFGPVPLGSGSTERTEGAGLPLPPSDPPVSPPAPAATAPRVSFRFEAASMYSAPAPARWSVFVRNTGPATANVSIRSLRMSYICGGTTTPIAVDQPYSVKSVELAPQQEKLLARVERANKTFKCRDAGSATVTEALTVSIRMGGAEVGEETVRVIYKVY